MEAEDFEQDENLDMKEYARGFNYAYILAGHSIKMAQQLKSSISQDTDFANGLAHGFNQFFYEREQDRVENRGRDYEETGEWEQTDSKANERMDELDDLRGDNEDRDIERDI